jgi:hypothetical protein
MNSTILSNGPEEAEKSGYQTLLLVVRSKFFKMRNFSYAF